MACLKADRLALQESAAAVLAGLTAGNLQSKTSIAAAGALPGLIALLNATDMQLAVTRAPTLSSTAAQALDELAGSCQHNRDAIIAAGALPPLVSLLTSNQHDAQFQATATIAS